MPKVPKVKAMPKMPKLPKVKAMLKMPKLTKIGTGLWLLFPVFRFQVSAQPLAAEAPGLIEKKTSALRSPIRG